MQRLFNILFSFPIYWNVKQHGIDSDLNQKHLTVKLQINFQGLHEIKQLTVDFRISKIVRK